MKSVLYQSGDGVAAITLNRPRLHNAFDEAMIAELTAAFVRAGGDEAVRAAVLRGDGENFCAGGDLNWMKRAAALTQEENAADALRLGRLFHTLNTLPKPTIALVQGKAFGGGAGLAACCDIVIAEKGARFRLPEVRLGLIPSVIAPYVIAAMGQRQARRYFMTAETFDADTAQRIGFVHEVTPEGGLDAAAAPILDALARGAPGAQTLGKKLILDIAGRPIDDALIALTCERIAAARASDEGEEGIAAFLEKREPGWTKGERKK